MIFSNVGAIITGKKTEEWIRLSKGRSLHGFRKYGHTSYFEVRRCQGGERGIIEREWVLGRSYSVQERQAQNAVAYVTLTGIHYQDVRTLSNTGVAKASFPSHHDFLLWWIVTHDEALVEPFKLLGKVALEHRPAYLYDGVRLSFTLEARQ